MSTVVVTDAGRASGIAFIRSLARAGHRVVAADDRRWSAGLYTRSASARCRYPDPYRRPDDAAAALLRCVTDHGVDVIVPMTDAMTRVAESIRDQLPAGCIVAAAPAEGAAVTADKQRTVDLAERLGVPLPATEFVRPGDPARALDGELGWPVVVKPVTSLAVDDRGEATKVEVSYAHDAAELASTLAAAPYAVLLQEYCGGDGVGVEILADRGRVVRAFSHRRLHEVPVTGGASSLRESIALDPVLLDHATRLVKAMDWTGLAMIEFKSGHAGDRLMEINGRPWGSIPLAIRAGVDFAADYVAMLTSPDGTVDPPGPAPYEVGVVARNLRLETVWIASVLRGPTGPVAAPYPPRRDALRAIAGLCSPRIADDVISWRDPLASVVELTLVVQRLAAKVVGR